MLEKNLVCFYDLVCQVSIKKATYLFEMSMISIQANEQEMWSNYSD